MGLKRQVAGQAFNPSASTWNAFVDLAEAASQEDSNPSEQKRPPTKQPAIVWVKNSSGNDLDRFCAVKLGSPLFTQEQSENDFFNRIAFNAVELEGQENETVAILQEPLASDKIGKAAIAGMTIAKIEVTDENHKYAGYSKNHPDYLVSIDEGPLRLVYNPGVGEETWGVVIFCATSNVAPLRTGRRQNARRFTN